MKSSTTTKQKSRSLSLAILLVAVLLVFINPADPRQNSRGALINNAGQQAVRQTDKTLAGYRTIHDSLEKITRWEKRRVTDPGNSLTVLFMGINKINECDICISPNEITKRDKHFVSLEGYAVKDWSYYSIEGNDYLMRSGESLDKKRINVRLLESGRDAKGITVLLPVSKSTYTIIQVLMYVLFVGTALAFIWLFIWLPASILINIAHGRAFISQNIRSLKQIGWGIIIACLIMVLLPWIMSLLFSSTIPGEVYFPVLNNALDYRWGFFLGFTVLMVARAFKQGYELQQEQDLTI